MEQNVCMRILGEWRNRRKLPMDNGATHIMYNLHALKTEMINIFFS